MSERAELASAAVARVGLTVGRKWRLERLIGLGGMAAVYEASHRNGKRVAVKVLHKMHSTSERHRKRFLREAYVANRLAHGSVVQIHDDGVASDGSAFLVMELLQGDSLGGLAKREAGRLSPTLLVPWMEQVLEVLTAAHQRGVIHRDLKPDNLFLTHDGALKVLDFGIARAYGQFPGATVDTHAGLVLGTPAFMPPEQARGLWDRIDARTDLWSLGATMFTLLSGAYVHGDGTTNELLGRAMASSARSVAAVRSGLSPALVACIDRALASSGKIVIRTRRRCWRPCAARPRPERVRDRRGPSRDSRPPRLSTREVAASAAPGMPSTFGFSESSAVSEIRGWRAPPAGYLLLAVLVLSGISGAWLWLRGGDGLSGTARAGIPVATHAMPGSQREPEGASPSSAGRVPAGLPAALDARTRPPDAPAVNRSVPEPARGQPATPETGARPVKRRAARAAPPRNPARAPEGTADDCPEWPSDGEGPLALRCVGSRPGACSAASDSPRRGAGRAAGGDRVGVGAVCSEWRHGAKELGGSRSPGSSARNAGARAVRAGSSTE